MTSFTFIRGLQKDIAHREGRTRSLQIAGSLSPALSKSLTLYPIELGGRYMRLDLIVSNLSSHYNSSASCQPCTGRPVSNSRLSSSNARLAHLNSTSLGLAGLSKFMLASRIIRRTMASLSGAQLPIAYTPEGAVKISYNTLVSSPLSLTASIGA